jgi:hypothetical protein
MKIIFRIIPILGLFILYSIPERELLDLPSICGIRFLFGFECMGCGMTRAFYYILHGQFVQGQEWNQNVFLVGGSLIGIYIFDWIQFVAKIEKSKAPTKVL